MTPYDPIPVTLLVTALVAVLLAVYLDAEKVKLFTVAALCLVGVVVDRKLKGKW